MEWEGMEIGDILIGRYGLKGKIIHICNCSECARRGFYEPTVEWENGETTNITCYDKDCGFIDYYKIGKNVFPDHLASEEEIDELIVENQKELYIYLARKKMLINCKKRLLRIKEHKQ